MRKLVLALSALLLLITPALAREPEEAAMPDFGAQALEQALDETNAGGAGRCCRQHRSEILPRSSGTS